MTKNRESWLDTFRALGQAFVEVLRAELAVLAEHWKRSAKELAIALGLFVAAASLLLVVLPAILMFAAVAGVQEAFDLPWWAAASLVALLVIGLGAVLLAIGRYILVSRFESPVAAASERLDDHLTWWNQQLFEEPPRLREGARDDGNPQDGNPQDDEVEQSDRTGDDGA